MGRLDHLIIPSPAAIDVRIETGVEQCDEISPFYDPMIAKVVVHSDERASAISDLAEVVEGIECWPVRTNAGFIGRAVLHPAFLAGDVTTGFLAQHDDQLLENEELARSLREDAATALIVREIDPIGSTYGTAREELAYKRPGEVWRQCIGFRLNGEPRNQVAFSTGSEPVETVDLPPDSD